MTVYRSHRRLRWLTLVLLAAVVGALVYTLH
jgi:hypothetical protein